MSVEMASSLLVHGLPWAAVGAVGGLAFGIGFGGRARAGRGLLGGLLGAVVGAFLYEMIAAGIAGSKDPRARRRDVGHPLARTVPGGHPARSRGCRARSLSTSTDDPSGPR